RCVDHAKAGTGDCTHAQSDASGIRTNRVVVISLNSAMTRYSLCKCIFIFKAYNRHRKSCRRTR
ncbi:hypothetical protein C0J52_09558, partial [Blattella germanica]